MRRLDRTSEGGHCPAVAEHWADGTPVWRGPPFPEPWGTDPRDRWVRLFSEDCGALVRDVTGCGRSYEELPVPAALQDRMAAMIDWYDAQSNAHECFPDPMHWAQRADMPIAEFNAALRSLARDLKAALPRDWTVIAQDVDAWCREGGDADAVLILRPGL